MSDDKSNGKVWQKIKVQHTEKVQMINGWRRQKSEKIVKRLVHSLAQKLWRTELGVGSGVLRYPPMVDEQDISKQECKVLDDPLITKTDRKRWVKTWLLHPDAQWLGERRDSSPNSLPIHMSQSSGFQPLLTWKSPAWPIPDFFPVSLLSLCWIWHWGPHSLRNTAFPCFSWSDRDLFSWFF